MAYITYNTWLKFILHLMSIIEIFAIGMLTLYLYVLGDRKSPYTFISKISYHCKNYFAGCKNRLKKQLQFR